MSGENSVDTSLFARLANAFGSIFYHAELERSRQFREKVDKFLEESNRRRAEPSKVNLGQGK